MTENAKKREWFTPQEITRLLLSLGHGVEQPFSDEDVEILDKWAHDARYQASLLKLVLQGDLVVSIEDGEVAFKQPDPQTKEKLLKAFQKADNDPRLGEESRG